MPGSQWASDSNQAQRVLEAIKHNLTMRQKLQPRRSMTQGRMRKLLHGK